MSHACYPPSMDARFVGDPVDTLTGAVFDRKLEFRLTGPLEFWWFRRYDSSQHHRRFAFGWGHTHDFDRTLRFDVDGISYHAPVGRVFGFPPLPNDGDECAGHGFILRRISVRRYQMFHQGEPSMEFEFRASQESARLKRLYQERHQIRFHYNAAGWLERIIDSAGRNIRVVEEADGRMISLTLEGEPGKPGLLLVGYKYDERGNLVGTTDGSGHGYTFTYDGNNRMLRRTGRKGFNFRFAYDFEGRCVKAEGDDRVSEVTLEYEIPGRVTKVTRADGGVWSYFFDEAGGLVQILDPLGGLQKYVRDKAGRVTAEVDPNGNVARVIYDRAGASVAKITPLGHRVSLPDDPNAPDPLAHRVAANPAEYEFGRLLDLASITLPDAGVANSLPLPYEARRFVATCTEGAKLEENGFDVRPLGVEWWPEPKRGRIFNDLGKLVQQQNEWGQRRHWNYDASGNLAQHMDFDCGKWSYEYGTWHFLLGETNPLGATVKFSYTPEGEVASFTDAGGTRSEYSYDLKDHLVEIRRHGAVRDKYTRDTAGNLLAKHAGDGRLLLQFEIGAGNLPIKRTLSSGDEHSFEYDKFGRHLIAKTKKDTVEFAYDALGNRCLEHRNGQGVEHRFRGWHTPAQSVFFGRFVVRYERRADGTLIIIDPGGKQHHVRFHPHGLIERRFSNGSQETAQYNGLGRCLFKSAQRVAGSVWNRRYDWSGEGELRQVQDSQQGEIRHEYDAAHRLRRREAGGRVEDYEFDPAENLVRQPGLHEVTLQEGNRLKTVNGLSFGYNDRNHIAVRQAPDGPLRYEYDSRDQLVGVDTPRGKWEAEYDALGRRTRKSWAGKTREFIWNTDQLIAEVAPDGRLRLYVYADPLALTPLLFVDYDSVEALPESCRRYFVFTDQIGTPCLIEDESGREVWRTRIEPFGQAQVALGSTIEFNLRFPGHYFDAELALHYNRFRYYDPALGRYLQSDPWGIFGGYNLYAYRSNPVLQVDARGLGEEWNPACWPPDPDEEGPRARRQRLEEINLLIDSGYIDPKDRNAPNFVNWIEKGGTVRFNNDGSTTYTRADGVAVTYVNGYPDFSPHTVIQVSIQQSTDRAADFQAANIAAGHPEWGRESPPGYTWHHNEDGTTMQLVPRDIHGDFKHTGGVSNVGEQGQPNSGD